MDGRVKYGVPAGLRLSQFVALVCRADMGEEEYHPEEIDGGSHGKGAAVAVELGKDAAEEDTEAYARIPAGVERGVGCAAAAVGRKVDEHRLDGGEHVTVAQADDQRRRVVCPEVGDGGEEYVSEYGHGNAHCCIVGHPACLESLAALQAREHQAY